MSVTAHYTECYVIWAVAIIRQGEGPTFMAKALRPWRESAWSENPLKPKKEEKIAGQWSE